MKKTTQMINYR